MNCVRAGPILSILFTDVSYEARPQARSVAIARTVACVRQAQPAASLGGVQATVDGPRDGIDQLAAALGARDLTPQQYLGA